MLVYYYFPITMITIYLFRLDYSMLTKKKKNCPLLKRAQANLTTFEEIK